MKNIGLILGGLFLLSNSKKAVASPTGSQLGNYATPPITRPASSAGRSQAASGGPSKSSSGGGGAAPGTQATGLNFWSTLENLFSPNKIDTSTSPDPNVPDFWANPNASSSGVSDIIGSLVDPSNSAPQFDPTQQVTFDDNGLIVDPDTGIPITANTDVTTPGGFFPDQFGPDVPSPDDSASADDFSI